jgi:hypothetical protein
MMSIFLRFFFMALLSVAAFGQEVNANKLTVGLGSAAPTGTSYMDAGTALEVNFGYRYTRYIQVDAGVETSFNKDYRNYSGRNSTGLTTTTNFFVPAGARIVIPVLNGRIEPSVGLGGVYRYDKRDIAHKNQGGVYGLGGVSYALDSRQRHRVGVSLRYVNILSAGRPHSQWVNVFGEYTFSWGE